MMKENKNVRIDEAALLRVLERKKRLAVELVIRLAWQAGMTRAQIHKLTWEQVSLEDAQIRLPTHTVPIHPDLLECLKDHRNRPSSLNSEYVVLTDTRHSHPHDIHIARIVGEALDEEEALKDVTIKDLRSDFIIRAIEKHGKKYALEVGNVAMTTLYSSYGQYESKPDRDEGERSPSKPEEIEESRLMELLAAEGTSPVAMTLWLVWKQGMRLEEITSLTWEQVDFKKNTIRHSDRESEMHPVVAQLLKEICDRREEGVDPNVILSPKAKAAFSAGRLSVVVKTALVKKGLGLVNLKTLSFLDKTKEHEEKILAYLKDHPHITRKQAESILEKSTNVTYDTLTRLVNQGKLIRVGGRYYLEGNVVPPEQHRKVICDYLKGVQYATVGDIANVLRVEKRACAWILHKMVEEGLISMIGQVYSLSSNEL